MCGYQQRPAAVEDALAMLDAGLDALTAADVTSLPTDVQARLLRGLERAESKRTAAQARVLTAFSAQGGQEDDGLGSVRAWLVWHTRVTTGAAGGAVGWTRRLAAHPVIAGALAAGDLSASWGRQICAWSDELPEPCRRDADEILACAAVGGADLADLAGLAREMYERAHRDEGPAADADDDGFADRYLRLGITFRGAGRTEGDLTPGCAAALAAVLDALGKKAGPEDARTAGQRRHDALEEACRRLIASGMLPGRAGQPTHVNVHMTLGQLPGEPGASAAERAAWATARATEPGWLAGPDADAAACDATLIPLVTGQVDHPHLDELIDAFLTTLTSHLPGQQMEGSGQQTSGQPEPGRQAPPEREANPGGGTEVNGTLSPGRGRGPGGAPCRTVPPPVRLSPARPAPARGLLRAAVLSLATDVLSGPAGLAALLRTGLPGPLASASLPLDIGAAIDTIPAHLRRAATRRHTRCAFPGCIEPASACEIHHIIPRSRGGPTALRNLIPLCRFHHLTVIHRWGWTITLNPDATTTATSPDGRILHSNSPPALAA